MTALYVVICYGNTLNDLDEKLWRFVRFMTGRIAFDFTA